MKKYRSVQKKYVFCYSVVIKSKQSHGNQESLRRAPKQSLLCVNKLSCDGLDTQRFPLSSLKRLKFVVHAHSNFQGQTPFNMSFPPAQDTKGNMWTKVATPYEVENKYLMFVPSPLYGRWQVLAL